jgi:hypothetical protein
MARSARADILRTVVSHPRPSPVSRLDVATPGLLHVAFVVSARGAVLSNFRGDALGLAAPGMACASSSRPLRKPARR